jgi:hypothetical protein
MKAFVLGIILTLCFSYRHEVVKFIDETSARADSYHTQDISRLKQLKAESP